MALTPGARLGAYEVTALIGEGGMGQVYRAHDTRLNREVALKVLPEAVAGDPDRLARFEREAQTLAALNHPNIAHIHGLEESDGVRALVMELVEGEDLSQRITRGAIPLDEALPIAKQIAEALEAAHEQGIIHRDLKPANIKVREDGTVKVLDFGLAKAMEPLTTGSVPAAMTNSPTITSPAVMTGIGVLLGTAAYMSPEQAKGKRADKRSDIWAFGAVLYEMLSGQRAFKGEDIPDTLAALLRQDLDWTALPASTSPVVRRLLARCLDRDVRHRLRDIGEARIALEDSTSSALANASDPHGASSSQSWWPRALLIVAGLVGAFISGMLLWTHARPQPGQTAHLGFVVPPGQTLTVNRRAVAISPNGSRIAYSADGGLFVRSLANFDAQPVRGADRGITPVFSPDGQSLVYYADSAIKRIAIDGGTPVTLCQVSVAPSSMAWTDATILYSDGGNAILRVSANGGTPEVLLDLKKAEDLAYSPQLLPDGDTLLFSIVKRTSALIGRWDVSEVVMQSLKTGVRKRLIERGSDARYVPTGHIVYISDTTLFAVPFDARRLTVTGGAVPVVEGVNLGATYGIGRTAHFDFSSSGSLVYIPGPRSGGQNLLFFDRQGGSEPLGLPPAWYEFPRVSPDAKRVAFGTSDGKEASISVHELSGTNSAQRLTFGGNNRYPIWSADGKRITFQSDRDGDLGIFWQSADGGTAERLTKADPGTVHIPESWSPRGDVLLFSVTKDFVSSLSMLSLADRSVTPFSRVSGSTLPPDAMFSPDGRWVAYQMGRSGLQPGGGAVEGVTYAEPFPPNGAKFQIAPGGRPMWSRDGKELFFVPAPGQFMAVGVTTTDSKIAVTNPRPVPRGFGGANPQIPRTYDVMPDGRILAIGIPGQGQSGFLQGQVRVVENWFEELKRLVPAN